MNKNFLHLTDRSLPFHKFDEKQNTHQTQRPMMTSSNQNQQGKLSDNH